MQGHSQGCWWPAPTGRGAALGRASHSCTCSAPHHPGHVLEGGNCFLWEPTSAIRTEPRARGALGSSWCCCSDTSAQRTIYFLIDFCLLILVESL